MKIEHVTRFTTQNKFYYRYGLFPIITAFKDSDNKIRSLMRDILSTSKNGESEKDFVIFNGAELTPTCYVTITGEDIKIGYIEGLSDEVLGKIKELVTIRGREIPFTALYFNNDGKLVSAQHIINHDDHKPDPLVLFSYADLKDLANKLEVKMVSPIVIGKLGKIINSLISIMLTGEIAVIVDGVVAQLDKSFIPYLISYNFSEFQLSRMRTMKTKFDFDSECSFWLTLLYRNEIVFDILDKADYSLPQLYHADKLYDVYTEGK